MRDFNTLDNDKSRPRLPTLNSDYDGMTYMSLLSLLSTPTILNSYSFKKNKPKLHLVIGSGLADINIIYSNRNSHW